MYVERTKNNDVAQNHRKKKKSHAMQKQKEKNKVNMHRNGDVGRSENSFSV